MVKLHRADVLAQMTVLFPIYFAYHAMLPAP